MNNKYHSGITVKNKLELTQISYARKLKKSNNLCNEVLLNEFISTLEKAIRKWKIYLLVRLKHFHLHQKKMINEIKILNNSNLTF